MLPVLDTKTLSKKVQRKLRSKTVTEMLPWGHGLFRTRLLAKAREYPNCSIIYVKEAYTSKTCGNCGTIYNVKGKIFNCTHCRIIMDRDRNVPLNILLKFITKQVCGSHLALSPRPRYTVKSKRCKTD